MANEDRNNMVLDAEIIKDDNIGKMPQNDAKYSTDDTEAVNEYFQELIDSQKKMEYFDDEIKEQPKSSFEDFNDFDDDTTSATEIEVYDDVESVESDVLYSTGDLAKMFDVSNQTIRNTADFFVEILSDERGANGQKLYTNADVAIVKKIFYMSSVQKFKRRDIRDQLLQNGISAKTGGNSSTNIDLGGLPTKDGGKTLPSPSTNNANLEVLQNKLSDAMGLLQARVFERLNEGFTQLESNINKAFSEDLQSSNNYISAEITKSKEEMIETIKSQAGIIEEQRKEIIKLKGTIININHTALEIDKGVKALGNETIKKDDLDKISENIGNVIKESSTPVNIKEELKDELDKINTTSQNTAKLITDEVAKQGQTLENIKDTVTKIDTNNAANSQGVKKSDMADALNRNYQKIEKAIHETKANQEAILSEKLDELASLLKDSISKGDPMDEALVDDLNEKLRSALESLTDLQKQKDELEGKNEISKTIIDKQTATIEELNKKLEQAASAPLDDNATNSKLEIAKKLIDKLSAENEDLKNKGKIQRLIIKKQEETIKSYEEPEEYDEEEYEK